MDFSTILFDYEQGSKASRGKQKKWWKDQTWNKGLGNKDRRDVVEEGFSRQDSMLRISSKFDACFRWLLHNNVLAGLPICEICCAEMELGGGGFRSSDARAYRCRTCLTKESVRHHSFVQWAYCTLMEFTRIAFYYFIKSYDPELVHREMTLNAPDGVGSCVSKSTILGVYALCREVISREQLRQIRDQKFGGEGKEVAVDVCKVHLRNKKGKNVEHLTIGFIEMGSGRGRALLIPNFKVQTIAQYISKTVALKSILYTPFYEDGEWDFL